MPKELELLDPSSLNTAQFRDFSLKVMEYNLTAWIMVHPFFTKDKPWHALQFPWPQAMW